MSPVVRHSSDYLTEHINNFKGIINNCDLVKPSDEEEAPSWENFERFVTSFTPIPTSDSDTFTKISIKGANNSVFLASERKAVNNLIEAIQEVNSKILKELDAILSLRDNYSILDKNLEFDLPLDAIKLLNGSELSDFYSELMLTGYDLYKDMYPTIPGGEYDRNNIPEEYKKYFTGSLGAFFEYLVDSDNPNIYNIPDTVIVHKDSDYLIYFKSDDLDIIEDAIIKTINELQDGAGETVCKREGKDVLEVNLSTLISLGIITKQLTEQDLIEINTFFS